MLHVYVFRLQKFLIVAFGTPYIFPVCWKTVKIIPIFKKGDKAEINNYRPIASINNLAKALEKIIYAQLYAQTRCWFTTVQHGFLPGR